ncbi:MAG TPA: lamin tail domain-containing protein, partial [Mycobacterium sp.]|nr:lamin tail domain-containing protein [Mycobacterium sp.]
MNSGLHLRTKRLASALLILVMMVAILPLGSRPSQAQVADLFFSEYVEGTSNNKALEVYNGTETAVDLTAGGYSVQIYANGNTSPGFTFALSGTVAAGDVFVLARAYADPAILAQADQTAEAGWYNGDDAVALVKNGTILDVIGQIGVDPGNEWGTDPTSTEDNTLRRKADICEGDPDGSDAFDPAVEWDGFAVNTFDGLGTHTANCGPEIPAPKINEFSASTTGTDVEYVELYGAPDTNYSAYTILGIEGDSGDTGTIDNVIGAGTTDASGFWLGDLAANTLENGTLSLLLVKGFNGTAGDDIDTDDDGTIDATFWSEIVDEVAVNDGGAGDLTYGVPALYVSYDGLPYAPGGASRYPDGTDTESTADWVRNDFDLAGIPGYTGTLVEGEAYNTPGAANEIYVPPVEACGDAYTPIYEVQGSGLESPLVGEELSVEGVVVGDFQNNAGADDGDLGGFYIQDPAGDGDAATSDGVLIYGMDSTDVSEGDRVRVHGTVSEYPVTPEYSGMTEISASQIWTCSTGNSVAATEVTLPVTSLDDFEPYEGMLVTFPQALYISEYYDFDRYGEIVLTTDRQYQPTAVYEPGTAEAAELAITNSLSRITLDDGRTTQNPDPAIHPNGEVFTLTNLFRGGDTVENVTGVLEYSHDFYRVQPTEGADYTAANPRPVAPEEMGGRLKVASFNVLNYFTTIDTGEW